MNSISVTGAHDVVVRRGALAGAGIGEGELRALLDGLELRGSNLELIVFGPCFGEEAATEFHQRLEAAGLGYVADFCWISMDMPDWVTLRVEGAENGVSA